MLSFITKKAASSAVTPGNLSISRVLAMSNLVQDDRPIGVETPLGKDKLLLKSFEGEERLSGLFEFQLVMESEEGAIDPNQIVGEAVSFWIRHQDGSERWFNGIVNEFGYSGQDDRIHHYRAHVVPWLWLLTRGSDCRVHECEQQQDAKDIIDALFGELGFSDYRWSVKRTLAKRNYCLQYGETHFSFVSRLLEEEGIYYYFEHEQGKHTLVLTDHTEGVYDLKDGEVTLASNLSQPELTDNLSSWSHEYQYVAGKYAMQDYDFENPDTSLISSTSSLVSLKRNSDLEFFEYPGDYVTSGDGTSLVKLRIEEEEAGHETATGSSECRTFSPGGRFKMEKHHNDAEAGRKWVLTYVQHRASLGGSYFSSGVSQSDEIYQNFFRCMPADVVFRPPRVHQKPRVMGMLSAIVVGPSGEEIHTDEHARIRVQFHWDRRGASDEKSSCWVRVASPWAGSQWGMIHIPRIGHEVIVSFINGDADQPVVVGSLYNGNNKPPYSLPDNKTQSGIKSHSSKDGSDDNFNEIRFEDKKDSEEIYIHAEKDLNCVIENNETRKVGFEDSDSGDQDIEIYNDQTLKVGEGSGSGSQTVDIEKDQTITLNQGNRTVTLNQGNDSLIIKQGNRSVEIKMGNETTKVSLGSSTTEAMQKIELKCGASSIKLEPASITIKSPI
jgi:type VI secretion system secreted protein VgrG